MVRYAWVLVLGLGVLAASFSTSTQAADDKEVTLKGTITCAKCDLKKEKGCATVIVVKDGKDEKVYYFDKDAHKKNHGDTCTEAKEGSVTGVTGKDGEKLTVKVSKVEYKK
jgi:hypothetical protein